ncbi:MAG: hypothetical protein K0S07_26 [Chlamydiales bacterium]|nr:hypothetical protein [Chlamydiales bacterium]
MTPLFFKTGGFLPSRFGKVPILEKKLKKEPKKSDLQIQIEYDTPLL